MSNVPRGGAGSLFLLDANNFVFRAYHGLPMLNAPDGTPVNAVHGYVQMIQSVRKQFAPEYFVAVFDAPGRGFRHEIFPGYKGDRPPAPEDLVPQFPLVRQATRALGAPQVEVGNVEADDTIATLAVLGQAAGLEVVVVSSDKDLMQLVDNGRESAPPIRMWDAMKRRLIGPQEVHDKFGVGPDLLGDLLALAGDSVDSVPGVPGIGPKIAAGLLAAYGNLEGVLTAAPTIKQKRRRERLIEHAADARMSRRLVELRRDVEVDGDMECYRDHGVDPAAMESFFAPLGFKATLAGAVNAVTPQRRAASASFSKTALPKTEGVEIDLASAVLFTRGTQADFDAYVHELRAAGEFSIWFEFSHAEPMRADVVGFSLARSGAAAGAYVPIAHRSLVESPAAEIEWSHVLATLGPALADVSLRKYCHDHKRVAVVLHRQGIVLAGVHADPMLASYTLDPARASHTLEALATDVLGHQSIARETVVGKGRKQVPFDQTASESALAYAAERAVLTGQLGRALESALEASGETLQKLFYDVEMPLAAVLRDMERRGVLVDCEVLAAQGEDLGSKLAQLEERICADAGYALNPESPAQLQKLLFEERGLPTKKKTKTGYSTDAAVLEELSLLDPIVKLILEHRSLSKLKGTYLDSLARAVHPQTKRLHSQFRQAVAQTGRLSSSDPNLQNIPIRTELGRRIREAFVAPPGQVLVAFDYSQIELRILAHLSQDANLCAAFREGADVHRRTAAEVFDVPEEEVSAEQRRVAKAVNFGVIYGQGAFGLARQLGIPQGKAGRYIKNYFAKIPGVDAYMQSLVAAARRSGWAETILGRRRRIPELAARGATKAYGERIARNTPIQGSAADILKVAMVRVQAALAAADWAAMVLTVHDELIFECDSDRVEALIGRVRPAMEGAVALTVPLEVDVGWGADWGAAKA
ncbi:MAG: DNA polymerase I [Nannocystaceae bacterium]